MRQTFELFSDIFARQDVALRRADPRLKVLIAFAAILSVLLSGRIELPLLFFIAGGVGAVAAGVPLRLILLRLIAPMGIVSVLWVLQSFMTGVTPVFRIHLARWTLTATREGMWSGTLIGSRVLGAVSVMWLLSSVTPAHDVFRSLRCFGVPRDWVEIAMLMYRYTFALVDDMTDVISAQRVRLGYSTVGRSLASMGVLAGTVVVRSFEQAANTHQAMVARGYKGTLPLGAMPRLRGRDWAGLCLALVVIVCAYAALGWRRA